MRQMHHWAALIFLAALGGLVQINPVWLYGPYDPAQASAVTAGSQPDWYVGWLDGALRIFPGWEIRAFGYTVANPFFPGALLPGITFGLLYIWPWLERRFTKDYAHHNLLDRPRDAPVRSGFGAATLSFYTILFVAAPNPDRTGASRGRSSRLWGASSLVNRRSSHGQT